MATSRWWLVLHGKAASDAPLREAVARMRARGIDLQVRVTWEPGDARRYVNAALAADAEVLVAGGGDGTLGEVAGALADAGEAARLPALAVLPLGTANDFASAAGLPMAAPDALQAIADWPAAPIDLLRVQAGGDARWCINVASGGFGTEVTVETGDGLKRMLGGLAYVFTGIARLGRIEPVRARLHGPGFDWSGDFIALGIGNGRQAGGGQPLCPDARVDDGLLDLTVIPELSGEMRDTLGALVAGGKRAALEQLAVRARLPWLQVEAPQPLTLNLDGEPVEAMEFRIDCVPARLRMHLPAECVLLSPARQTPAV